jgi:hypothetical protein
MDIEAKFEDIPHEDGHNALKKLIQEFCEPAFGALPKREIELSFFETMRDLGILPKDASLYQLMSDLRITRSKANALVFDLDVRQMGDDQDKLDKEVQKALIGTRFAKDGDYFVLEIENPLVNAHLKERIRKLHHISDTSFNSAIIRIPVDAVTDLVADMMSSDRQELVRKALVKAGAKDDSFKGILKSSLSTLGKKVLGKAADTLADDAVEFGSKLLEPIFNQAGKAITSAWKGLFQEQED